MTPRRGENPPLSNNSTSQTCRPVRSNDGHYWQCALRSAAGAESTTRLTSSPPCGAIRWLVVKSVNLLRFLSLLECAGTTPAKLLAHDSCRSGESGGGSCAGRESHQSRKSSSFYCYTLPIPRY